jgi:GTP-binding protein EngB required for normal cell division
MISMEKISKTGFNENHQRRIHVSFQYIDELLNDAERAMATAGSPSLFNKYSNDTTPLQRKIAHDYIGRIRAAMRQLIEEYDIPVEAPHCGALWAAQTSLLFADISVGELRPDKLLGYGSLSDEAARALETMSTQLHALLNRLQKYLAQGAGGDLEARLQRLGTTNREVALLREIERVITAHGLVELRGTLAMIIERAANSTFEIGVFGRVSSGKSSLLNHLLEREFLPVGVTPVTAIPTRVRHGKEPRATISFAGREAVGIELSELAEFSTEQQNPGNAKHVTRIDVEVDASRLKEGITFVDTPGVGSLALAGAEETVAYLPRCDLGLVLIDAASSLTHEDMNLLEALYRAGAIAMALISKADLLDETGRRQLVDYVRQHLRDEAAIEPPVHLISVAGGDAKLCDRWFENELRPLLDAHKEQAAAALRRKIGGLLEAVIRALENRLRMGTKPSGEFAAAPGKIEQALRDGERLINAAYLDGLDLTRELDKLPERIIEQSADKIAETWSNGGNLQPAEIFAKIAAHSIDSAVGNLLVKLDHLRDQLSSTLRLTSDEEDALPVLAGVPTFDASTIGCTLALREHGLLRAFGKTLLLRRVRSQVREQAGAVLNEGVRTYSKQIMAWTRDTLKELGEAFTERTDRYRSQRAAPFVDGEAGELKQKMEEDLRALRQWGAQSGK